MKRFYLFLALIVCATAGFAQSFTVSPSPVANMTVQENTEGEATIYFRNETSNNILLVWDKAASSLHSGWSVSICDNELCYFSAYQGDTMLPVAPQANGFLKFTCMVHPGEVATGSLTYAVHVAGDPSTVAEVTFNVNGIVSVKESSFANQISISPNPVSSTLTMRATTGKLEKGEVQVYDLSGKLLREVPVKGLDAQEIDVQTLPEGAYLLRYLSDEGVVTRRFLKYD